jgi:hypothetical protein
MVGRIPREVTGKTAQVVMVTSVQDQRGTLGKESPEGMKLRRPVSVEASRRIPGVAGSFHQERE